MSDPAPPRQLPSAQRELLAELADLLQVDELLVYGGAALDLLVAPQLPSHDIDVAVVGLDQAHQCRRLLLTHPEVGAVSTPREYWIRFNQPVVMFDVEWRGRVLDLNFVDAVEGIGHFDVECVRWHHPSATYTDPHDVLASLPVRDAALVSGVESENPLLLLNRAIRLAAKYGISLEGSGNLAKALPELTRSARQWASTDAFHGREAAHAHTRALASATQRASGPARFLDQCLRTGVIDCRHPVLAEALREDEEAIRRLAGTRSYDEFWAAAEALGQHRARHHATHPGGIS
ncbi:hypothetical protein [Streptomyces sp. NRRL WC-3742]|uniref:hypothetical protein n=1 Tax=Streptomyces sp. NRRL WC-3742 TaxID=1463934 RepID=UPI0004C9D477|nr:hypothetical protein [Streptomyces sp. NRRL WC-3742]